MRYTHENMYWLKKLAMKNKEVLNADSAEKEQTFSLKISIRSITMSANGYDKDAIIEILRNSFSLKSGLFWIIISVTIFLIVLSLKSPQMFNLIVQLLK